MSLALQYDAPLEKVGDLLADAKFAPCGPVVGHDRIKRCSSSPDLIGGHVLVQYCRRQGGPTLENHTRGRLPYDYPMEKPLTPKQEQFCRAILIGKNQSEAYRQAYNCKRTSDATVNVEASRLMDHPRIALRIKELTAPVVAQIQMTRAEWLSFMEKILRFDPRKMFDRFGKLLEIGDMEENERLAIADFEKVEHLSGKGENRRVVGVTKKLKFIDRLKALEILGKAKGFYRNESDGDEGKIPPRVEVVFVDGPSGNGQVNVGESRVTPKVNFVGYR